MDHRREVLPGDGSALWAGMENYVLEDVHRRHQIRLDYVGEPPHGDSVHELSVDGRRLPGFVWGCKFAVDPHGRHLAASWMAQRHERKTIVIDMQARKFTVLPVYIGDFVFSWPRLVGAGQAAGSRYEFTGQEEWTGF